MKDYRPGYMSRTDDIAGRSDRLKQLTSRLESSADRLCHLQDRLHAGAATMKPIELERLLDEYRAEQVRYDRIDRELQALEDPRTAREYVEGRRMYQQYKNKINY